MPSTTSSFRISDDLKRRLEALSERLGHGKNWILNRALEEYIQRHTEAELKAEARRQSLLVSRKRWKDEDHWARTTAGAWDE